MYFTPAEIDQLREYKRQKLSSSFTLEDEYEFLNYHHVLMQNLLKEIEPLEARMKILSYGIVLLKRFYLRYTILEKPDLHQHVLTCTYLAMKLDEIPRLQILQFAEKLKAKPKHQQFVHYGQEEYAKHEMIIVYALNYQIQIKPIFHIVEALGHLLCIQDYLKSYLYTLYVNQTVEFFQKALQDEIIFIYKEGIIGLCIVEAALHLMLMELQSPHTSTIVGPNNRPVGEQDLRRFKDLYQNKERERSNKLFVELLPQPSEEVNEKVQTNRAEIVQLVRELQHRKESPKQVDWSKFNKAKQQQFQVPESTNVVKEWKS